VNIDQNGSGAVVWLIGAIVVGALAALVVVFGVTR